MSKDKLSVGCFSKAFHRKFELIQSNITLCLDANLQNVPVKAYIVEGLECCYTGNPLAANIFNFVFPGWHTPHLHQSGEVPPGLGGGGGGSFFS